MALNVDCWDVGDGFRGKISLAALSEVLKNAGSGRLSETKNGVFDIVTMTKTMETMNIQ